MAHHYARVAYAAVLSAIVLETLAGHPEPHIEPVEAQDGALTSPVARQLVSSTMTEGAAITMVEVR